MRYRPYGAQSEVMRRITALAAGTLVLLAACSSEPQTIQGGSSTGGPGTDPESSEEVQEEPKELNLDEPLVLVDGWSASNLKGTLRYEDSEGKERTTKLVPLNADQVNQVASKYPDEMARILTYTVTTSNSIGCGEGACFMQPDEGEPIQIDLGFLTNPSEVPTIGGAYAANNVTSLLWAGQEEDMVSVDDLTVGTPPLVLAAGLGRVFENTPLWLLSSGEVAVRNTELSAANDDVTTTLEGASVGTALKGLGSRWGNSTALDDSYLTAYTAPTRGCPGFLCATGTHNLADSEVEVSEETVKVCTTDSEGEKIEAAGVLVTTQGTLSIPHQSYQWGPSGLGVNEYTNRSAQELVEGEVEWNGKTLYLLEPSGKPVWFAPTSEISGNMNAENLEYTAQDILDEFAVYEWEVCG